MQYMHYGGMTSCLAYPHARTVGGAACRPAAPRIGSCPAVLRATCCGGTDTLHQPLPLPAVQLYNEDINDLLAPANQKLQASWLALQKWQL